jgi:hypothetical protein
MEAGARPPHHIGRYITLMPYPGITEHVALPGFRAMAAAAYRQQQQRAQPYLSNPVRQASDARCLQALAEVLLEALAMARLAAPAGGGSAAPSSSGSDDDLVCLTPAPDAHARLRESLAALLAAHRELGGALRRAGPLFRLLLRVRGA